MPRTGSRPPWWRRHGACDRAENALCCADFQPTWPFSATFSRFSADLGHRSQPLPIPGKRATVGGWLVLARRPRPTLAVLVGAAPALQTCVRRSGLGPLRQSSHATVPTVCCRAKPAPARGSWRAYPRQWPTRLGSIYRSELCGHSGSGASDLPSWARVIPTCAISANSGASLSKSTVDSRTETASTCTGLRNDEGSAAAEARYGLQA